MKSSCIISLCSLLLTTVSYCYAQAPNLSMEPFKPVAKEWKMPKGSISWSVIDVRDDVITAYKYENSKLKLRRFDYNFNIIASREFKFFYYDVHVNKDVINILFLENKDRLMHWSLDIKTLEPVKIEVLDVSDDYYIKRIFVSWSKDKKYVGIRRGNAGVINYYDEKFNRITDVQELESIKKLIDFSEKPWLVYEDEKTEIFFTGKPKPSGSLESDREFSFSWREKNAEGKWEQIRECDFGKKEEDFTGNSFKKIDIIKRELLSAFVYEGRLYWIEYEKHWKGWQSKNDTYRLLLKSYAREGECEEVVLADDFKTMPLVYCLSEGQFLIWQQPAIQDKQNIQRLGTLTIPHTPDK